MKNSRLDYLDALRGWAAFAVIVTHVGSQMGGKINLWTDSGARGVQLFFVLSAFTLFYTHERLHSNERQEIGNFFIRRFFRIAPMFYVTLLTLSITGLAPSHQPLTINHTITLLTFTHGLFPEYIGSFMTVEWSLSNEMIFYLFVPALFVLITNTRKAIIFTIGALIIGDYATVYLTHHSEFYQENPSFPFFWLPNQMASFFFGITLYFIAKQPGGIEEPLFDALGW